MDKAFKGRAVHKLLDSTQVANVDNALQFKSVYRRSDHLGHQCHLWPRVVRGSQ